MKRRFEVSIRFDPTSALSGLAGLKRTMAEAIESGVELASEQLIVDCRPYIPIMTGRLRDSGHVEFLKNFAFKLVWDAANPKSGYVYAGRQYEKVLQHVDGKYAAEWVEKVFRENPGRYQYLAAKFIGVEIERRFRK